RRHPRLARGIGLGQGLLDGAALAAAVEEGVEAAVGLETAAQVGQGLEAGSGLALGRLQLDRVAQSLGPVAGALLLQGCLGVLAGLAVLPAAGSQGALLLAG